MGEAESGNPIKKSDLENIIFEKEKKINRIVN